MTARLLGVDLARTVALLGMFAAHLTPSTRESDGSVPALFQLVAGRSSALFALLAGVSLVLVTRRVVDAGGSSVGAAGSAAGAGSWRTHRARLLVRAGAVAAIGLFLGLLPSGVAVILVYYGLLFCCAVPVLRWRASSLALLALAWGLLSPALSALLRPVLPPTSYQVPSLISLADPWQLVTELLVTGYYPVLTWATYLFAGMAAGKLLAPAAADRQVPPRTVRLLLLPGAWLAVLALGVSAWATRSPQVRGALLDSWGVSRSWGDLVPQLRTGFYGTHPEGSWWWQAVWVPHSGTVVDLAHTTGTALLVLGACLLLVRLTPSLPWRALSGAGAMTLTLYSVHVVVLSMPVLGSLSDGVGGLVVHGAAAVVVGAAFAVLGRRGPLESCVREVTVTFVPAGPVRPGR